VPLGLRVSQRLPQRLPFGLREQLLNSCGALGKQADTLTYEAN